MFGWSRRAAVRASRTKRWRKLRLPARSAVSTLSATWRPRCRCSARNTTPIPPRPATASILKPASSSPISGRRTAIRPPSSPTPGAVGLRATSSDEPGPTLMPGTLGQTVESAEDLVDVSRVCRHVEDRVQVEFRRRLAEQLPERSARVPGTLGVLLDDPVRLVARAAALYQRH